MAGRQRIVGVDVGGTFTDLVLLDPEDTARPVRVAKVPTTPDNQAEGVLAALEAAGAEPADLAAIVHGTTTTTNALLERKLARTGLITTRGFRDVLELGRRTRPRPYGMTGVFEPLIPRQLRLEVAERMDYAGRVVVPLAEEEVEAAARRCSRRACEAVVVHFLHAYANPAHELRAGEIVRAVWPNPYVTLGHRSLARVPRVRARHDRGRQRCVQPVLHRYLGRLRGELAGRGFAPELLVMQGNGGTVSARIVAERRRKTVMSGPASGVMAAAILGAGRLPEPRHLRHGRHQHRRRPGPRRLPPVTDELELEYGDAGPRAMVDVHTIGAGGGSIARVDAAGLLRVGPRERRRDPGPGLLRPRRHPADHHGRQPRARPARPGAAAGRGQAGRRRPRCARSAREVGAPLGLSAEEAAAAVRRIANDRMAGAIRMVSLARGHDPRDYALFAFGGAGPLHAVAIARELGIPTVIVPARPGITNAIGCAVADLRHDFTRTVNAPLEALAAERLAAILAEQVEQGRSTLAREGVEVREVAVLHSPTCSSAARPTC